MGHFIGESVLGTGFFSSANSGGYDPSSGPPKWTIAGQRHPYPTAFLVNLFPFLIRTNETNTHKEEPFGGVATPQLQPRLPQTPMTNQSRKKAKKKRCHSKREEGGLGGGKLDQHRSTGRISRK